MGRNAKGFTLIELLIVISIIALLASLVLVGIHKAKQVANEAKAKTDIDGLVQALKTYETDNNILPGWDDPAGPTTNSMPKVLNALLGIEPKGRTYLEVKEDQIFVYDEVKEDYKKASSDEVSDPKVNKFLIDPWGMPYIVRENRSKREKQFWMHRKDWMDILSTGPNEKEDVDDDPDNDDIANWRG